MARILLNTRASRITIAGGILLLPAEVKKDERLGKVVSPSKTLISERPSKNGGASPHDRILRCRQTRKLFDARIIEWSDEKVDEPGSEPAAEPAKAEQKMRLLTGHRSGATSPPGAFKARDEAIAREEHERIVREVEARATERHIEETAAKLGEDIRLAEEAAAAKAAEEAAFEAELAAESAEAEKTKPAEEAAAAKAPEEAPGKAPKGAASKSAKTEGGSKKTASDGGSAPAKVAGLRGG